MNKQENTRLYFADNLRVMVILSLIPFHAALTYTGNGDVFAYEPGIVTHYLDRSAEACFESAPLDLFVDILDNFFMRLLFLVSGIVAWFALGRRNPLTFLGERSKKLFIPLASGIVLIIPVLSYIRNVCLSGYNDSFWKFYPLFYNSPRGATPDGNFEWGHLWFLIYLFTFSLLTLPFFSAIKKSKLAKKMAVPKGDRYLFLPIVIMLLFECLFRPGWPGTLSLFNDWANFTNYLLYYISGFAFAANPNLMERLKKLAFPFFGAGLFFFILKLILWNNLSFNYGYNYPTYFVISCKTLAGYFLVLGIVGIAARYLNQHSDKWNYLGESSFGIYIFHFLPVSVIAYFLIGINLNFYLKFGLTVILSYPLTFLLYEICRRISVLCYLFSLKKPDKKLNKN